MSQSNAKSAVTSEAGTAAAEAGEPHSWIEHPATVKRLQVLVVVLGVVLIAGFATVIGRIAYLAIGSGGDHAASAVSSAAKNPVQPSLTAATATGDSVTGGTPRLGTTGTIVLPVGTAVRSVAPLGAEVMVHVYGEDGDHVVLFDPGTGEVRRRWRLLPGSQAAGRE